MQIFTVKEPIEYLVEDTWKKGTYLRGEVNKYGKVLHHIKDVNSMNISVSNEQIRKLSK